MIIGNTNPCFQRDGAYIPADTNQLPTLILTESKYKTGDPSKLVSRFS